MSENGLYLVPMFGTQYIINWKHKYNMFDIIYLENSTNLNSIFITYVENH